MDRFNRTRFCCQTPRLLAICLSLTTGCSFSTAHDDSRRQGVTNGRISKVQPSDRPNQANVVSHLHSTSSQNARPIPSATTALEVGAVQVSFNAREEPPLPDEVASIPIEFEQFVAPRSVDRHKSTHTKQPALRRFKNLMINGLQFQETSTAHSPQSEKASSDQQGSSSVGQHGMIPIDQMDDGVSESTVNSSAIINDEIDNTTDSDMLPSEPDFPRPFSLHPFPYTLGGIERHPLNSEATQSHLSRPKTILKSDATSSQDTTSSQTESPIRDNDIDASETSASLGSTTNTAPDHHNSTDSSDSVANHANERPLRTALVQDEQSAAVMLEGDTASVSSLAASTNARAAREVTTPETDSTTRLPEYTDPRVPETVREVSSSSDPQETRSMGQYISSQARNAQDLRRLPSLRVEAQSLSPRMQAVILRANRNIRYAFDLGSRGAVFSARAEFIKALRLVAQSLDETNQTNAHSRAVTSGLLALQEADDFILQDSSLVTHLNVKTVAAGHHTNVIQIDAATVSPFRALQMYYEFAKRQLALAGGNTPASSMALYGLARIEAHISREENGLSGPKAIVLNQAALLVDENNYLASNQLGVLFARFGQLDRAQVALSKSLSIKSYHPTWHNLSVVYQRMGEVDLAVQAASRARIPGHGPTTGSQTANSVNTAIRWVDLANFNAAGDQSRAPQPRSIQRSADKSTPPTTSQNPKPPKGFFKRFSFKAGNGNTAPQPDRPSNTGSMVKP